MTIQSQLDDIDKKIKLEKKRKFNKSPEFKMATFVFIPEINAWVENRHNLPVEKLRKKFLSPTIHKNELYLK